MSRKELKGFDHHVALNADETVGVMQPDEWKDNQTRTAMFSPDLLREWADMVEETYQNEAVVEVVFTPNYPLLARKYNGKNGEDASIGIAVAPRVHGDKYDELTGDEE